MTLPLRVVSAAALACCAAVCAAAQESPKFGTIFKREVDDLVRALSQGMREDGALGDGSALATAKILTAMGHCHRFYGLADGPVVREPVHFLFTQRLEDGSFGSADHDVVETTRWVAAALRTADPAEHRSELVAIRMWLTKHGVDGDSPWDQHVREVAARIGTLHDGDPERAGAAIAAELARGPLDDTAASIDALLELVACQQVARALDRGQRLEATGFPDVAQRGFDFLLTRQKDGLFFVKTHGGEFPDTGLTGMGIAALQTKPRALRTETEQATIDAGLAHLREAQNDDGSFGEHNVNYTSCAAILALSMAADPQDEKALVAARNYILQIQNIEDRGYARGDRDYGSIGYGGDQRGDLSNLGFAVDALRRTGLDEQHESFAKALVFLQRTQNFAKANDFGERRVKDEDGEWRVVRAGDDGGAMYYPGNSPAGYDEQPDGSRIPRSYGSMTYMLLRTYTLCGVPASDERVQRAVEWIANHWTLDENPGSSPMLPDKARYQGLYYYYMVLAQALDIAGIDPLMSHDPEGGAREIDWRAELHAALEARQREDGSWVNSDNDRWWEGQPTLCTIYAMLALERCRR